MARAKADSQLEPTAVPGARAQLAASPGGPLEAGKGMDGAERAAVLLLALGNQYGAKIWAQLDDDELRQLGVAMSTLGTVTAATVEAMMVEVVTRLSSSGAVMGNFDATERLLRQVLPG